MPAPPRYLLAPHQLEHSAAITGQCCSYESETATGGRRPTLTETDGQWRRSVTARHLQRLPWRLRALDLAERTLLPMGRRLIGSS